MGRLIGIFGKRQDNAVIGGYQRGAARVQAPPVLAGRRDRNVQTHGNIFLHGVV
jgi:hypothetical protein